MKITTLIQRWGLLRVFALSGFVSILGISIVSGSIYFSFLQQNLLAREMAVSSEFIQSVSLINNSEAYFEGSMNIEDKSAVEEFFSHVIGIPDVFRATVFGWFRSRIQLIAEPLFGFFVPWCRLSPTGWPLRVKPTAPNRCSRW